MASRESWRRQIAHSNAAQTNQWKAMIAGRARYNAQRSMLREVRLEALRLEVLKLPYCLLPWGWISEKAKEFGTSPSRLHKLLKEIGHPGYWPRTTDETLE